MELRGSRAETPEDYHTMQDALYRTLTPELGRHLHKSINLGLEVSYSPDAVIDWLF